MRRELTFEGNRIELITRDGELWVTSVDVARALGYKSDGAVSRIYRRNADEFTDTMTETVKLTLSGNLQKTVRIFSLRGAHLVAMFARTKAAKAFRRWVLDILDALHNGGEYVMQQYRQAKSELEQGREVASACGKGLNRWKHIKHPLEARLEYWSERRQLPLLLNQPA